MQQPQLTIYKTCCPHCGGMVQVTLRNNAAIIKQHKSPTSRHECTGSGFRVTISQVAQQKAI